MIVGLTMATVILGTLIVSDWRLVTLLGTTGDHEFTRAYYAFCGGVTAICWAAAVLSVWP